MVLSKTAIALITVGVAGVSSTAIYAATNWGSTSKNSKGKKGVLGDLARQGYIVQANDAEATPLPSDLPTYTTIAAGSTDKHTDMKTFGGRNRNLLVGEDNNDEWWKWSLKRIDQAGTLSSTFNSLKSAQNQSDTQFTQLKEACSNVYKKQYTSVEEQEKTNAWFLCSPYPSEPKSAKTSTYPKIDTWDSYEDKQYLIANLPSNKNVWDQLYDQLIKNSSESREKSVFINVKSGYSKETKDRKSLSLNQACEISYSIPPDDIKKKFPEYPAVDQNPNNMWKYCSFTGQEPQDSTPPTNP